MRPGATALRSVILCFALLLPQALLAQEPVAAVAAQATPEDPADREAATAATGETAPTVAADPTLEPAAETATQPVVLKARTLRGPRADVAALLLAAEEGGSLWAAGLVVPRPVDPELDPATARIDFWLELDGARLLSEAGLDDPATLAEAGLEMPEFLRLELHAYALNRQGELAGAVSRRVSVPMAEHGDRLRRSGVRMLAPFDLGAGEYQLRVLVREPRSQRFVLRLAEITVPTAREPYLGPPRRSIAATEWISAQEVPAGSTAAPAVPDQVLAAFPVIFDTGVTQFEVDGRLPAGTRLGARLLDGEGGEVARPILAPDRWPRQGERLSLAVELGEVAPGPYRLELSTDGGLVSGARMAVLPRGVSDGDVAWTRVDRLASQRPATAGQPVEEIGPELEAERGARNRVRAIAMAYRQVLEVMAGGSFEDAVERLDVMESEVLASGESRSDALDWLLAAEERVARQLARENPEALLPLMVLHLEVYGLYDSRDIQPLRLIATRRRMHDLAQVYGEESKEAMSRRLAATVLAEAGIAIDRHNMPQEARRMLEAAFELDDANPTQLLYLGYWYERRGFYEQASKPLARLVEVDPSAHEGRLRLALCQRRLGKIDAAEAQLRDLLSRGAEPWLEHLAYQELARILLAKERVDEAIRLLEEAVARYPDHQRLHLQLVYALERGDAGYRVAERLRTLPADQGRLSARNLYSRRPRSTLGGAGARLRRHATGRLPILAVALGQLEDEG